MAHIYFTRIAAIGSTSPTEGRAYIRNDGTNLLAMQTIPPEVKALDRKPQLLKYRKRIYNIGQFSRMLMRDEYGKLRAGGVRGPKGTPVLAAGSGTGGSAGIMIGYQTFATRYGSVKVAESNPSPGSAPFTSTETGRAWSGLDNAPDDPHVTHSRLYVSVDGEVPALAAEIALPHGTTYDENKLTAALGECLPVRTGPTGGVELDPYARGVPPYTMYAEEYHDAFFYAGDPAYPERIYPSRLFEPEAVNTTPVTVYGRTEYPWLSTTDGMPVTGIKRQGDELVVGTLRGIDVIQGYSHGDYRIFRVSNYWGVLSHFSMRRCGPLGSLFFAAPQGVTLYNAGAFKFAGEKIQSWWRENFRLYPEVFENSYGAEDRYWRCYKLLLPQFEGYSLYLNLDYFSAEREQPIWVMDRRNRNDQCTVELLVDNSASYYDLYTGGCDGYVRKENIMDDADDDGDTYQKKLTVTFPHRYVAGQDGDDAHGRTYNGLDLFVKHDTNTMTISLWAGDDDAPSAVAPQWAKDSVATAAPVGDRALVKKTSERHVPTDLSGKGVTLRLEVTAPLSVEIRGYSIDHIPGPQSRPFSE
jgi:hypothetical protein